MPSLSDLAVAYLSATDAEEKASAARRELARKIQEFVNHFDEGQKTFTADSFKVTVKHSLHYSMDWDKWAGIRNAVDELYWPVEEKPVLDIAGVKYLQRNMPDTYRIISPALTIKPAAVQVAVTVKE